MARRGRREGRPRRRGCGGCLGLFVVLFALVAAVAVLGARAGIPVLDVARTVGERALGAAREALDEAGVPIDSIDVSLPGLDTDSTPPSPEDVGYAGSFLPASQQDVYLQLLGGIRKLEDSVIVLGASATDIDPAYKAIMRDHPELFWLDGSCSYTYTAIGGIVTVKPGMLVSADEVPALRAQIEAEADAFLQTLPADASEYDTARAAYEYVIRTTDYDTDAPYNQSILSVFLSHRSVCAGYARTYQYLLQRAGMFCTYVNGTIATTLEDHAWDLARIDGEFTYVDPTWGDPTYQGEGSDLLNADIIYDYLCLTTDELTRDNHILSDEAAWPTCTAGELDYYRRAGLMFDAYDGALSGAFWQQEQTGGRTAAFKFSNEAAYAAAYGDLVAGNFLHDDLLMLATNEGGDALRYGYSVSDPLRIIKLYW